MEIYLITCILSALVLQFMVVVTYFQKKLYFLLNIILASLVIIPYLANSVLGFQITTEMKFASLIIMAFFPVYYSLMIQHKFFFKVYRSIIAMYILSFILFILIFVTSIASHIIIISYGIVCLYLMAISLRLVNIKVKVFIFIISIIQIACIIFTVVAAELAYYALLPGLFVVLSFFPILYNVREQVVHIVTKVSETNKRLSHTVSRLKQSNEQTRRIIFEKDLELYQLARHASLAELTAGIAHELAQPLTGIKGIAQNMIDDINYDEFKSEQGIEELTKISSLVDKSTLIIDHIRNFSRKNVFSMKYLDVNKVVLDAIDLVKVQLKKNDIELVFVLDENIPRIYADRISIEQLFLNMIINAKDAILEKKNTVSFDGVIRVSSSNNKEYIRVIIEDNGVGIPKDNIEKIWSPFFTTKKRDYGTGIGLSISNKIIMEHKAAVDVESSDEGTVFTISFPISQ